MTTHVLDTSAILAHYLREPGADEVNQILEIGPSAVGLSPIAVVELHSRLRELIADETEFERVFQLYSRTLSTRLPFGEQTLDAALELRSAVRPRLPLSDCLIAASAKEHAAILVHRDPHMSAISNVSHSTDCFAAQESFEYPSAN